MERKRRKVNLRLPSTNNNSLTLNLDVRPQRQLLDGHARAAGLDGSPVLFVGVVHVGEERHVREEDVDLDDGVEVTVGRLQDGGEVLDYAVLLKRGGGGSVSPVCLGEVKLKWACGNNGSSSVHLQCGPRRSRR